MKVTVLGSGGSGGVPLPDGSVGGYWGACDPAEPRNRRRRVSVLVEEAGKTLLIDCSPDLREQLLDRGVTTIDAVLFTHSHADHCHGLDDLRALVYRVGGPIPAYMDATTREILTRRFEYVFASTHALSHLYPALLDDRTVEPGVLFEAAGLPVMPIRQDHGLGETLGFRIGGFAYSTDVVKLDEAAFELLQGLDLWIVDCLRFEPHPTHSHFKQTLGWIERLKPKRTLLTHMNQSVDYHTIRRKCPPGVEPAWDGLVVEL